MSKSFTEDNLAEQLSHDITWRIREISDLKSAVRNADGSAKPTLLRATVALLYAHWEGHVRFSAQRFLSHIALRKLKFSSLSRQFLRNHFLPRLSTMTGKSVEQRGNIVDAILDAGTEQFSRVNKDLINTRANLNFDVLTDICRVCGISIKHFADKESFIDVILLKRRNAIAHGEDTLIDQHELDDLADQTIALMRVFSNEIQNMVYLQSYRTAGPSLG